ncbi:DUF3618 domain-containing protein [Inquilinus limosus]|uniref:DUF3618 domain-containing protein n=1 Tax=Inquilinus limosus TaxID=171674 RepID=UPI0004036AF4|nr:DUF3618 domain-containing protein [Inquilinus limosus]
MTHTEQLERESEQYRAALSDSLAELRTRMTPGHVLDEVMGYTRDSTGAAFVGNLKRQAVDNPLPLALVGTGLAWLMLAGTGRAEAREPSESGAAVGARTDTEEDTAGGGAGITEMASRPGDKASDLGQRVGTAVEAAGSTIGGGVSSAYEGIASRASRGASAVGGSAAAVGHRMASVTQSFRQLCRDEPLVLAGLGIAIGAALGAMLPETEIENRTVGSSKDKLKQEAEDFALRQLDKADQVAEHAVKEAGAEAERLGLTGEGVTDEAVAALERGNVVPPRDPSSGGA